MRQDKQKQKVRAYYAALHAEMSENNHVVQNAQVRMMHGYLENGL